MNDLRVCNFLIRYASNTVRLVNLGEYILYEMMSHNYYVFMQTLIKWAYRGMDSYHLGFVWVVLSRKATQNKLLRGS